MEQDFETYINLLFLKAFVVGAALIIFHRFVKWCWSDGGTNHLVLHRDHVVTKVGDMMNIETRDAE